MSWLFASVAWTCALVLVWLVATYRPGKQSPDGVGLALVFLVATIAAIWLRLYGL